MTAPTLDALLDAYKDVIVRRCQWWAGERMEFVEYGDISAARQALVDYVARLEAERDAVKRRSIEESNEREEERADLRAQLAALRAEGKEYEVRLLYSWPESYRVVVFPPNTFNPGDRVTVRKVGP